MARPWVQLDPAEPSTITITGCDGYADAISRSEALALADDLVCAAQALQVWENHGMEVATAIESMGNHHQPTRRART